MATQGAAAVSMAWDPLQREVLAELGHPAEVVALWDDPIFDALLVAVGRDRHSPDAVALVRGWPAPGRLRGNAAAKRALWPQLRGLRRRA